MGYFRELPNIAYQSPLLHKNSSRDYLLIKNIFRRTKLYDFLENNVSLLDKFTIGDGDRPDTVAEQMYGCLLYTSPSPRDRQKSRMPSSA